MGFNKEMFLGGLGATVGGILGGEIGSHLTGDNFKVSIVSSLGDMTGYYGVWGASRYLLDKKAGLGSEWLIKDMSRFGLVSGLSAIVYYGLRIALNGYWLAKGYEPAYASLMAQIPSSILSSLITNSLWYKAGMFKRS